MRRITSRGACGSVANEHGFVIIGVVMFVLALTILGLSLFNLSSYEAQFLGRSHRSTQTLYDAMNGLEWARMVLGRERKLQAVDGTQPAWSTRPANVVSVEAWQGANSNGNINFTNGVPIRIRALADDLRGERRMVEMQYGPIVPDLLYRHVIDSYSFVRLIAMRGADTLRTVVDGQVRLNENTYPLWQTQAWPPLPPPPIVGGVPQPQVASFIAAHPVLPANVINDSNAGVYFLTATEDVSYFLTPESASGEYSMYDDSPPYDQPIDIYVTGTCVWMFPRGVRFNRPIRVLGTGADRLIIVAGPFGQSDIPFPPKSTGGTYIEGIWLFSGIRSDVVPVVLVSSAQIVISRGQLTTFSASANAISIFGQSVYLEGPSTPSSQSALNLQGLVHTVDMDAVIDELIFRGALPNLAAGGQSVFDPIPGTWREIDPDNPS